MSAQDTLAAIDAAFAVELPSIESTQASYIAEHGRYLQVLSSPESQFGDGVSLAVDEYLRIDGAPGFVCRLSVTIDGDQWFRCVNFGPEDYRSADWQEVTDA